MVKLSSLTNTPVVPPGPSLVRWSAPGCGSERGVQIENENQTLASITFQNYFRSYEKLVG
ncbi:hypothetical protein ACNKHU_00650 [Shigella flexneri]